MKKPSYIPSLLIAVCSLFVNSLPSHGVVSVGGVSNLAFGSYTAPNGIAADLLAGGITIGFFSVAVPTVAEWAEFATRNINVAYTALRSATYGFTDVRSLGGNLSSGFKWDFPNTLGGTVSNIPFPSVQSKQLFVMAFDQGTFANNFAASNAWAVASDLAWAIGADNTARSIQPQNLDQSEIIIGNESPNTTAGNNAKNVILVPEPSSAILMGSGLLGLLSLRRRGNRS